VGSVNWIDAAKATLSPTRAMEKLEMANGRSLPPAVDAEYPYIVLPYRHAEADAAQCLSVRISRAPTFSER